MLQLVHSVCLAQQGAQAVEHYEMARYGTLVAWAKVIKRNDVAKKATELERLNMALRDNIVTPEVKANGWGGIDSVRFAKAIEQIGLTYKWKATPPKPDDIFDASFLPNAADRKFN